MQQWIDEAWEKIVGKFTASSELAARMELIPYKSENGTWIASPFDGDSWWTNGFWPALMWQLYAGTEDERFLREARRVEKLLQKELMSFELLNHDVGFMYLLSSGADYKLTGSDEAWRDTLHAATILAGRFNPTGFIRAWGQKGREGWAIVDCMMNLALLYWAHEQTGDPRFLKIARTHADTTMRCFVRPDGSCNHIVIFDPETGEMLDAPGGQGYCAGSSWSRGQSWALYGFVISYLHTGDARYLDTAKRVAHYFISNIRADGLIDCDFRQPKEPQKLDNIASACAACGLLELADCVGEHEQAMYRDAAVRMLRALCESCADWSDRCQGILTRCTAAYHEDGAGQETNITYGDYFFVEAIAKLRGTDPMLWK